MRLLTKSMVLLAILFTGTLLGETDTRNVQALVSRSDIAGLKALGAGVLPVLVRLYETGNENQRTNTAYAFYNLGWKSAEAKKVLMRDVHTQNSNLRLQVQWALGRVSDDADVVEILLDNMTDDANPLFRDKAACALAYDQIHLTEKQKVRLFEGLIEALADSKLDVRRIALLALEIHTGQTKGFNAEATLAERGAKILLWQRWLEEYQSNL